MTRYLSIRDLQKISGEAIQSLPGPTAVKSGGRTVAVLFPIKKADPERLAKTLARARALAAERDPAADAALIDRAARGEPEPGEPEEGGAARRPKRRAAAAETPRRRNSGSRRS